LSARSSGRLPELGRSGNRNRHPLPVFERRPPLSSAVPEKGLAALFCCSFPAVCPGREPPREARGLMAGRKRSAQSLRSLTLRFTESLYGHPYSGSVPGAFPGAIPEGWAGSVRSRVHSFAHFWSVVDGAEGKQGRSKSVRQFPVWGLNGCVSEVVLRAKDRPR
jgi:hypothetical protein